MSYRLKILVLTLVFISKSTAVTAFSHTVASNETLYSLSKKYRVSIEFIRRVNNLTDDLIYHGDELEIPVDGTSEIIVQPGDSLSGLSYLFDISERSIMEANNLSSESIQIGQVLKIPPPVPEGFHRVLRGETILGIASRHGLSAAQLRAYNNIQDDVIYPDQLIVTQPPHPEGIRVVKGQSLWEIAQTYGVSMDDLRQWNSIGEKQIIHPGEILVLYPHITNPASIIEPPGEQKSVALASVQSPVSRVMDLPREGEYFYSKPLKDTQPSVTYWEGPTASAKTDYQRARKILEAFKMEVEQLPVLSRQLDGWHLVLDPGHGGLDPGSIVSAVDGNGNSIVITEDEYVYDISLRAYQDLVRHGASVDLTIIAPDHHIRNNENARKSFVNRKSEVYHSKDHNETQGWRPVGNIAGLDLRKTIASRSIMSVPQSRRSRGTLFVSIHADNSANFPEGTAVLYDGENKEELARSKAFAAVMARNMGIGSFIHQQNLRVLKGNPADAAILVEVRNVHYTGDAWALRSTELRDQDARMLVEGILDWARQ